MKKKIKDFIRCITKHFLIENVILVVEGLEILDIKESYKQKKHIIENKPYINVANVTNLVSNVIFFRSSLPEVFLEKGVLKVCCKFTGERSCWNEISIKLLCNFIALQLYWNHTSAWVFSCKFAAYFQKTFLENTSGGLLLLFIIYFF